MVRGRGAIRIVMPCRRMECRNHSVEIVIAVIVVPADTTERNNTNVDKDCENSSQSVRPAFAACAPA